MEKKLDFLKKFGTASDDSGTGIARTLMLSALVGAVAGLGAVALLSLLQVSEWLFLGKLANYAPSVPAGEPEAFHLPEITGQPLRWALLFLPAAGALVSSWIVQKFAPEAAGHGTDAAIEAYHFRGGRVRPVVPPVKAIATSILIGTGGSAGCEGPITQIGSGFGSMLANLFSLPAQSRRVLMAAGMGAGVGALFHAPMAGALFAAEVLYRDLDLEYEVLVPSIIASVTGYAVFSWFFGFGSLFETPQNLFSQPRNLLLYILLAFILAGGARFYTWFFYAVHEFFNKLKRVPVVLRPALGGLLVGIIGFVFLPALCSGYGVIQDALKYKPDGFAPGEARQAFLLLAGVFVFKTLSTAFSVGSGGSGGIFGPAIVVGGALGGATGIVFSAALPAEWNVPVGSFTLVGMVAFFGCAAKTPISTILMVSEMTGNYRLLVPSMWVCIIAYMLSRKVSLYRSQLPNRFDAPAHRGSMISGVMRNVTVGDVMRANKGMSDYQTVTAGTTLDALLTLISSGTQSVFPVIADDTKLFTGVVTRRDVAAVASSDPMLRRTLMVEDLQLADHELATENDTLGAVLRHLDAEDVEGMVVVSRFDRNRPIGVITSNDIVETYQREITSAR